MSQVKAPFHSHIAIRQAARYFHRKTTFMLVIWNDSDCQQTAQDEDFPLKAHLCLRLRVRFLLSEQIEVGRHDDARSLVRSV